MRSFSFGDYGFSIYADIASATTLFSDLPIHLHDFGRSPTPLKVTSIICTRSWSAL
jgi:hypothetical protein